MAARSIFLYFLFVFCESGPRSEVRSDVVELTDENFDELVTRGQDSWLLEFYAPWCGHCKALAPVFEDVATAVRGKLRLGKIDCTAEKGLQKQFEVKSFPTLKFWRDGVARPYKEDRNSKAMVEFGIRMAQPAIVRVTLKSITALLKESPIIMIYLGPPRNERVYERVAYKLQGLLPFTALDRAKFKKSEDKKIDRTIKKMATKFGLNHDASKSLVAVTSHGAEPKTFRGPFTVEDLKRWVENHSLPLVTRLSPQNYEEVVDSGKLTVFAVYDPATEGRSANFIQVFRKVARANKDFIFAMIDGARFNKYTTQFGYSEVVRDMGVFVLDFPSEIYYVDPKVSFINAGNDDVSDTDDDEEGLDEGGGVSLLEDDELLQGAMQEFISSVREGKVLPKSLTPWYSPTRFFKAFEKWVSQFSEMQLVVGLVCIMLLLVTIIVFGCSWGLGLDEDLFKRIDTAQKVATRPILAGGGITEIDPAEISELLQRKQAEAAASKNARLKKDD